MTISDLFKNIEKANTVISNLGKTSPDTADLKRELSGLSTDTLTSIKAFFEYFGDTSFYEEVFLLDENLLNSPVTDQNVADALEQLSIGCLNKGIGVEFAGL